ncbi:uncharacterized protein Tco025E_04078 [Trypanosoma conorhini]|uniref:Uncharacterized protein n=1 Tax=Trypanosoma conorhini TaxID=83891 RepID=A0A422PPA9_9TRYP|nr:uncharacterized protein Tco025E_04078 [Trypanosoma conorhini]RNF19570.1 hypothetical protein Tco025E_04078 [Trypanosoma conorhini]
MEFMWWLTSSEAALPILNTINKCGETVVDVALRAERYSGHFLRLLLSAGAREARDLYAVAQRRVMGMEEKARRRETASEGRRWRRLQRAFGQSRANLLHCAEKRRGVADREEDGRRRLWLGEHRARGRITEQLTQDLVLVAAAGKDPLQAQRALLERKK